MNIIPRSSTLETGLSWDCRSQQQKRGGTGLEQDSKVCDLGDGFKLRLSAAPIKEKRDEPSFLLLVRVFITDLILRHSAEVVETYSQSAENACVYKEFCNTKGI